MNIHTTIQQVFVFGILPVAAIALFFAAKAGKMGAVGGIIAALAMGAAFAFASLTQVQALGNSVWQATTAFLHL